MTETLIRIEWLMNVRINPPIPGRENLLRENFWSLVQFLQNNQLTTRSLATSIQGMTNDFEITNRDLTAEGFKFFYAAENVWHGAIQGDDYEGNLIRVRDQKRFERALAKFKKKEADKIAATSATSRSATMSLATIKRRVTSGQSGQYAPSSDNTGDDEDLHKYDDASWHSEAGLPDGLPEEAGATHIGLFLAWAILSGLGGEELFDDFDDDIEALKNRSITPGAFVLALDGRLTSEELSKSGNAFAKTYYEKRYLDDYQDVLAADFPSPYAVSDSWVSFDKLKPVLDKRLMDWKRKRY